MNAASARSVLNHICCTSNNFVVLQDSAGNPYAVGITALPRSLTKLPLTVKSTSLLPAHACECRWKPKLRIFLGLSQMF